MKKISSMTKRISAYIAAAAIIASASFMGTGFYSEAADAYVKADTARVRVEATTSADLVGTITNGTEVDILETQTATDGYEWHKVRYYKGDVYFEGWVRSDLLTTTQPSSEPTQEPETTTDTPQEPEVQEPVETPEEPDVTEPDYTLPSAAVSGDGYQAAGENSFSVMGQTLTISSEFIEEQIPEHFAKADFTYNSQAVSGLKYDYGNVLLVYLTDEAGTGEFFVLDMTNSTVFSYVTILSGDSELILLVPPADEQIAASYGKTIYAKDEDSAVTAYQYNQYPGNLAPDTVVAEYYYVYGITKDGEPGWFLYDAVQKSYVRSTTDLSVELESLQTEAPVEVAQDDDSLEKMIIVVMGAICFICIIMTIVFCIRSARANKNTYEEDDEEDDDADEEHMSIFQRRKQEREYRHFMDDYVLEDAPEYDVPISDGVPEYDVPVSGSSQNDLADTHKKKEDKQFDDIESILLAGLMESVNSIEKEAAPQKKTEPVKSAETVKSEEMVKSVEVEKTAKNETENWKDLEFLDL